MYVLDADLNPLPVGVAGELYIGGVGVARGYLNRPGLTAERFVPDPFRPRRAPGSTAPATWRGSGRTANLEFLGRIDHQVKIRGYRIELGEIEARLLLHPRCQRGGRRRARGPARRQAARRLRRAERAGGAARRRAAAVPRRGAARLHAAGGVRRARRAAAHARAARSTGRALPDPRAAGAEPDADYAAPRTPTEEVLAAIWAEVLGVDRVGVRDDFFDLGGHSLAALRLAGRVHAALGTTMHVTSLLQAPTVEAQAARIDGRAQEAADGSTLVAIRTGGSRPPLVLVHAAGGNVLSYAELARLLAAEDRPVYALASRGLDDGSRPLASIEEMAEDYLRSVEAAGLGDEVVFGGWSMGGLVAYEMARRTHERSGRVVPLVFIDSYAPGAEEDQVDMGDAAFLSWFAYDWGQNLGVDLGVTEEDLAGIEPGARIAHLLERARERGAAGADIGVDALTRVAEVVRANVRAAIAYRPLEGYPGPITVLSAADEAATAGDPAHGWRTFTTGEVTATTMPGDHYGILREPNLKVLAGEIVAALAD